VNDPQARGTALVTGGFRRIGAAIARRLALEGYALAIHASARSLPEASAFAASLSADGAQAIALACDLADPQAVLGLIPSAEQALGAVTVLVNNASIFEEDSAKAFDIGSFERHIAVNLRAPVQLASILADRLPPDREGCVVNVLDQRVWRLKPEFFSYTLSKAALWTATRTLAQTFAPRVRVNAVGPGPSLPNQSEGAEGFTREVDQSLLRRAAPPAEVAEAVAYLARATSVTGQMIAVDAGQHLT